jgi:CheY-like chemotaxis protein
MKPVILTVDDDADVLNAIERDLRQHFRADYRIVKVGSGAEALDIVRQLKQRGASIALFLVDERMPHMTGTQFLIEAITLFPDARKVLLTAYADTETAITAINKIGLDQYLTKPWDPPTERLYPALDDLLAEWAANVRPAFVGVRVGGTTLSPASFAVKDFRAHGGAGGVREVVRPRAGSQRLPAAARRLLPSAPQTSAEAFSNGKEMRTMPACPVCGEMISSLPWCVSMILRVTVSPRPSPTFRVV